MGTPSRMAAPMHGDSVKPPRNPMMQMVQGFADGGLIGGAVDAIKNRQNTLAAIDASSAPAPAPQAAPAKPSMGSEADNYAAQAASIEAEQQAAAKTRMAAAKPKSLLSKLGFSEGGKIKGKGTPTSDSISAEVADTGEQIKVSTDERIISAAQDEFLQKLSRDLGFPSLEAMLEAGTGRPVGPTVKEGKPAAAGGGTWEELKNLLASEIGNQPRPKAPPMNPSMANVVTGSRTPVVTESTATAPVPAATPSVVRSGNSFSQATPAPVVNPLAQETRDYSLPEGTPVPFTPRVEVATPQQKPVFQVGDASMKAADPKGYSSVASQQPGAQERTFSNVSGAAESTPAPAVGTSSLPNLLNSFVPSVAATPPAPAAGRGFVNPLDAAAQKQNDFTEVGKATSAPAAGRGFVNPLDAAAQKQNGFTGVGKATSAIGGPLDAHGNSLAATNEMKNKLAELTSTAPANAVLLGDSGRVESQALMDKWGRESQQADAMRAVERNTRNGPAIASLVGSSLQSETVRNGQGIAQNTAAMENETRQRGQTLNALSASEGHGVTARGQDIGQQTAQADNETRQRGQTLNALSESEGHSVTARGQDVAAQTHAAQLAGNPLNNELTRTQTASLQSGLDDKKQSAAIVQEMQDPKTTPERRKVLAQTVLASQGKTLNENRYLPHNTKTYNEMGQVTGETAVMFDKETGQYVTPEGAPAKVQPLPAKADLKAGQVYPTKNGPATWNGKEFVPVKK